MPLGNSNLNNSAPSCSFAASGAASLAASMVMPSRRAAAHSNVACHRITHLTHASRGQPAGLYSAYSMPQWRVDIRVEPCCWARADSSIMSAGDFCTRFPRRPDLLASAKSTRNVLFPSLFHLHPTSIQLARALRNLHLYHSAW